MSLYNVSTSWNPTSSSTIFTANFDDDHLWGMAIHPWHRPWASTLRDSVWARGGCSQRSSCFCTARGLLVKLKQNLPQVVEFMAPSMLLCWIFTVCPVCHIWTNVCIYIYGTVCICVLRYNICIYWTRDWWDLPIDYHLSRSIIICTLDSVNIHPVTDPY